MMSIYANQNYRINRPMKKTASPFDALQQSNRAKSPGLAVSTLSPKDNEQLRSYISKQAEQLDDSFQKEAMDKVAFFSNGMDFFTKTRAMIADRLGLSEDAAHDLTPSVLRQADRIQQQYGGEEGAIIQGIIEELGTRTIDHPALQGSTEIGNMKNKSTEKLSDHVKNRLINETRTNSFEADRMKLAILKEAKNLETIIRPHTKYELADAIIDFAKDRNDMTLVYGISGNSSLIEDLKEYL